MAQNGEHHHILGIIVCEGLLEFLSEILGFPLGFGEAQAGLFRRGGLFFLGEHPRINPRNINQTYRTSRM